MLEFLDKLRKRPEHERQIIAFVTALIFTLIIASVWFSILILKPSIPETSDQINTPGPLESVKNLIDSGLEPIYKLFK